MTYRELKKKYGSYIEKRSEQLIKTCKKYNEACQNKECKKNCKEKAAYFVANSFNNR